MAKNEKVRVDEFSLDSGLDFDNFLVDDINGQISPEAKKPKSRAPVNEVFQGTISGAVDRFKSPSFLASLTRKAMPESFGVALDTVDSAAGTASALYDEAVRDLKPQASRLARKVDRLVPDERKSIKAITSRLARLFGADDQYSGPSKEQQQEQSIQIGLAQIFDKQQAVQAEIAARDAANQHIQNDIDNRQFKTNLGILTTLSNNVGRMASYKERVEQAVQKKSLELQYRSFFALADISTTNRQYYEVFKAQNEAIAKNTSLPEFVKIKNSERFKDLARTKFIDKIQGQFFGEGSALDRGIKRLGADLKQYVAGIKQGLESASMGVDAYADMQEMNKVFSEMGQKPISGAQMAGSMAGGWIADKIGAKVAGKIRPYAENYRPLTDRLYRFNNTMANLPGAIESYQGTDKYKERLAKGGMFATWGDKLLNYGKDTAPDLTMNNPMGLTGPMTASVFNDKTQRSITDIIPGYLARILREITVIRSGDNNTGMMYFDSQTGKFVEKKNLGETMKKVLAKSIKNSSFGLESSLAASSFASGQDVTEDQKKGLTEFLAKISTIPNMEFTPENIMKTNAFKTLSPEMQNLVRTILEKKVTQADDKAKGQYELTRDVMKIRNATPDVRGSIELLLHNGFGEALEESGLVKQNEDGDYVIDEDAYYAMVRKEGIVTSDRRAKKNIKPAKGRLFATSDVFAKEDIHPLNPKRALNSIRKTGVFDWFYKKGKGDNQPHRGPMAQDVNRNMGENAAPGGTKIDLTTMNGNNMAAIQELADRQDKLAGGKDSEHYKLFEQVSTDVKAIREVLEKGGFGGGGTGGGAPGFRTGTGYKDILTNLFTAGSSLMGQASKDMFGAASKVFKFTKDKIAKPLGSKAKDLYDRSKEPVTNALMGMLAKAGEMATRALDIGRDVIFNKLPAGWRQAAVLGDKLKEKIKSWINQARDVYVQGRDGPVLKAALIRAGYYRDKVTGKVIKTMDDLANLKGDIVNQAGETILTVEEAANGLYDQYGEKVKTSLQKLAGIAMSFAAAGYERAKKFWKGAAEVAQGGFGKLREKFGLKGRLGRALKDLGVDGLGGGGGGKVYDVLVEIRDILRGDNPARHEDKLQGAKNQYQNAMAGGDAGEETTTQTTTEGGGLEQPQAKYAGKGGMGIVGGAMSFAGKIPGLLSKGKEKLGTIASSVKGAAGAKGKARALLGGTLGSLFKKDETAPEGEQPKEQADQQQPQPGQQGEPGATTTTVTTKKKRGMRGMLGSMFNDRDGSGRRDGSWEDRLEAQAEKDKARKGPELQQAVAKYDTGKDIFQNIAEKASAVFGFLTKGVGGIFSMASGLMSAATSVLGLGGGGGLIGKIGGLFGKGAGAAGSAVGAGAKVAGTAANAAGAASTVAKGAGKVGLISRIVSAGSMLRNVATFGALMTGGAGGVVMGAVSAGLSAIGAVLASPVVLGAAAVAAVGYGAYKLYKYATRNKVEPLEKVRMSQYGLNQSSAVDVKHNHYLLALEEYLLDGRVGYSGGKAFLLEKKIDKQELLDIFSIDKEDELSISKMLQWFDGRFKPFFLTSVTSLYSIDKKYKLNKADKDLSGEEKMKFLQLASFESGPYSALASPFKDMDRLSNTAEATKTLIKEIVEPLKKKAADKAEANKSTIAAATATGAAAAVKPGEQKPPEKKGVLDVIKKGASSIWKDIKNNPWKTGLLLVGSVIAAPSMIAGAALAGAAYGVYKLYKYATRNNVDTYEKIRMTQYGLNQNAPIAVNHNSNMLVLEEYLLDGRVGYSSGKAYLLDKKVLDQDLLDIFSIDKEDAAQIQLFTQWFQQRFKPFFLTHVTSLYSVNKSLKLTGAWGKLKDNEKIKLLGMIGFDSGPYSNVVSPFKDMPRLGSTLESTKRMIEDEITKIVKNQSVEFEDTKAKARERLDQALKPTKAAAAETKKAETDKAKANQEAAKKITEANKQSAKAVTTPTEVAEDGPMKESKPTGESGPVDKTIEEGPALSTKLKTADGPLRDGSQGMQFLKLANGANIDTMNPAMRQQFLAMIQEYGEQTGKSVTLNSGSRTQEEQEKLWRQNPKKAAPPGRSLHEFGLAIDANSGDLDELEKLGLMRKYGFTRPVGGEPWHSEAAGIQVNLERAKKDPDFAAQAIGASLMKGGGGVGSIRGTPLGKRDSMFARAQMTQSDSKVTDTEKSDKDKVNDIVMAGTPAKVTAPTKTSPQVTQVASVSKPAANDTNVKQAGTIREANQQSAKYAVSNTMPDVEAEMNTKAAVSSAQVDTSGPNADIKTAVADVARKQNVNPNDMLTFAAMESRLNPNAKASGGSSASGLFGYTNATWGYQLKKDGPRLNLGPNPSPFDVEDSTMMASEYYKTNRKFLSSVKPNPTMTDVYLAHFLGPSGARKFLTADPNAIAADILPDAAAANKTYFYEGSRPLTVAEVYRKIDSKLAKKAKEFGINYSGGGELTSRSSAQRAADQPPVSVASAGGAGSQVRTAPTLPGQSSQTPAPEAPRARPALRVPQMPQMSAVTPDRVSSSQSMGSTVDAMSAVNTNMAKQVDLLGKIHGVLEKILDNTDMEKIAKAFSNNKTPAPAAPAAPRTQEAKFEGVKSAVDLSRKVA